MIKKAILMVVSVWLGTGLPATSQPLELAVQKGHSAEILFVTFNGNGRLLASSGADNLIKLWHVPTGKEMASFVSASAQRVQSMAFSAEDDYLYVQYADGSVHTWDISRSTLVSSEKPAVEIPFRNQKRYVTKDGRFEIHADRFYLFKTAIPSGKNIYSKVPMDISKNFTAVAIAEKDKWVIGTSEDGNAYVFDLDKGRSIVSLEGHLDAVNSACLSPDEDVLATASSDRSIILWSTRTWKPIRRLFSKSFRFECLAFDPSGHHLAVGDELGKARIVDLMSSRLKVSTYSLHEKKISSIQFSPNDSILYTGGYDNRIVSFNFRRELVTGKDTYRHYFDLGQTFLKLLGAYRESFSWVNTLSVNADGTRRIASGGWRESAARKEAQEIRFTDLQTGKTTGLASHQGNVSALAFLDESQFVSGDARTLVWWYAKPNSKRFFFRKSELPHGAEIRGLTPLAGHTILVNATGSLIWYDLKKDSAIRTLSVSGGVSSLAWNKQEHRIAYATGNDIVIAGDQGEAILRIQKAHTDRITGLAFSPARSLLASTSWDATVKLWDPSTGELLATIIPIGMEDHIILTQDNYYFGTRNALKGIGFKSGKQFISPEQLDLRFNRPDIVLKKLGFAMPQVINSYRRAYEKRLQRMNFTEAMLGTEVHLPEISVNAAEIPLATSESVLKFEINATDSQYKLDRINVFVNNIPLYGMMGIDLRSLALQRVKRTLSATLSAGRNKIQVSCLNEKGVESLLETMEVDYVRPVSKPTLYLSVISVSRYDDSKMNLKYAAKDGHDLAQLFSRKGDRYGKIIIDSLFNEKATRENIRTLKKKFMESGVDDEVMVFVSGHGMLDDKMDFYFGTHDVNFSDPANRGLKYDDLETLLDGIPARSKLLMIDACHSGEVDKTRLRVSNDQGVVLAKNTRGVVKTYTYQNEAAEEQYQVGIKTSFELMQELFTNVSKGSGAVVISAAAGNSYALESDEWRNGIFTYSILYGIRNHKADLNHDGIITVNELKEFVSKEVEQLTEGAQKPTSRSENLEFDFRVW